MNQQNEPLLSNYDHDDRKIGDDEIVESPQSASATQRVQLDRNDDEYSLNNHSRITHITNVYSSESIPHSTGGLSRHDNPSSPSTSSMSLSSSEIQQKRREARWERLARARDKGSTVYYSARVFNPNDDNEHREDDDPAANLLAVRTNNANERGSGGAEGNNSGEGSNGNEGGGGGGGGANIIEEFNEDYYRDELIQLIYQLNQSELNNNRRRCPAYIEQFWFELQTISLRWFIYLIVGICGLIGYIVAHILYPTVKWPHDVPIELWPLSPACFILLFQTCNAIEIACLALILPRIDRLSSSMKIIILGLRDNLTFILFFGSATLIIPPMINDFDITNSTSHKVLLACTITSGLRMLRTITSDLIVHFLSRKTFQTAIDKITFQEYILKHLCAETGEQRRLLRFEYLKLAQRSQYSERARRIRDGKLELPLKRMERDTSTTTNFDDANKSVDQLTMQQQNQVHQRHVQLRKSRMDEWMMKQIQEEWVYSSNSWVVIDSDREMQIIAHILISKIDKDDRRVVSLTNEWLRCFPGTTMMKREGKRAFRMFFSDIAIQQGQVKEDELILGFSRFHAQRSRLSSSMRDWKSLALIIERLVNIVYMLCSFVAMSRAFAYDAYAIITAMGYIVISFSFALGNPIGRFISSFIFIINRPFDVGDKIMLDDGNPCSVHAMNLLSSSFLTPTNQLITIGNHMLQNMKLINLQRSRTAVIREIITVDYHTPNESLQELKQFVINFIHNQPTVWKNRVDYYIRDQRHLNELEIEIAIENRLEWHETQSLRAAESEFLLALRAQIAKLGIIYMRCPIKPSYAQANHTNQQFVDENYSVSNSNTTAFDHKSSTLKQ